MSIVDNDPRGVSKKGKGKNQLDINLEAVKDKPTREALEGVLRFVRELVGGGLDTDGDATMRSLETDSGGAFRVKVFEGTVRARDGATDKDVTTLKVPGVILGAFGYSQVDAGAQWDIMSWGQPTGSWPMNYWMVISNDNTDRKVQLRNMDSVNANKFRAIVFYTGDRA